MTRDCSAKHRQESSRALQEFAVLSAGQSTDDSGGTEGRVRNYVDIIPCCGRSLNAPYSQVRNWLTALSLLIPLCTGCASEVTDPEAETVAAHRRQLGRAVHEWKRRSSAGRVELRGGLRSVRGVPEYRHVYRSNILGALPLCSKRGGDNRVNLQNSAISVRIYFQRTPQSRFHAQQCNRGRLAEQLRGLPSRRICSDYRPSFGRAVPF